eukprot:6810975-Pyramimonas_sp.AAC.1
MTDSRDSAHAYRGRGRGGRKEAAGKDVELNHEQPTRQDTCNHETRHSTHSCPALSSMQATPLAR